MKSSVSKLYILVWDTRRIPPQRAGACNTSKEPAGGLWGILNKDGRDYRSGGAHEVLL